MDYVGLVQKMRKREEKVRLPMKKKNIFLNLLHRIKTQLLRTVSQPFRFERLSHMFSLREMEKSEVEKEINDNMIHELYPELAGVENAKIVPEISVDVGPIDPIEEENWDVEETTENVFRNAFPFNSINSELDCPNFGQLSVQSNEEIRPVISSTTLDTDEDLLSRGILGFTFRIENVADFVRGTNTVYSEIFNCRNIPFNVFVQSHHYGENFAIYLKRHEAKEENFYNEMDIVVTQCEMSVDNNFTGTKVTRQFCSRIFPKNTDWGFTYFLNASESLHQIVINNTLTIHVSMKADPPYCDGNVSKSIIGYVGIRNQGATCYMNSLLQAFFHLKKFRTSCYRIPTEMDLDSSMALALQKVFYNLQFSDMSVCTKALTNSFGWSSPEVLQQQDIQEMMRILIEKIENRMKNTLLETILASMFQGKFVSYVKCRDIEFSSQREEIFYDIQFSLENSNNVMDSFRKYVSPEIMDNENKYDAGSHGLQTAEKGTLFISLPQVMFLHLLRFQFDTSSGQVIKNNNFYEFYEHIDLTEFVREEENVSWKYSLFAVLSHSGGGSHGHYVAYVNPLLEGNWFKFDDEMISVVQKFDAVNSNFGSNNETDEWIKSMQFNAYMLVYVRDSCVAEVFEEVSPMYISEELKLSVQMEGHREYRSRFNSYYNEISVYVLLSSDLESEIRFSYTKTIDPKILLKFSVNRDLTTNEFKKQLQSSFDLADINQMRIWPIVHSSSGYSYPIYIEEDVPFAATLAERRRNCCYYAVWLEMALPGLQLPPFHPDNDVLVYYYYYCAVKCQPYYIHHGYHGKDSKVDELIPILNELMGWSGRELNVYQDVRQMKACKLDLSNCFSDYVEQEHNTFVINIVFELKEHDESTKFHSIELYYADVVLRAHFAVCNEDDQKMVENFEASTLTTFPEFLHMLAIRLNYEAKKIQLFKYSANRTIPSEAIPSTSTDTLNDLVVNNARQRIHFSYKLHQVDVIDVETKHKFTFTWLSADLKKFELLTLYLSDDESIESILSKAEAIIPNRVPASGIFRVLRTFDNKLKIVMDTKEIYEHIATCNMSPYPMRKKIIFRIEEIPIGDDVLNENEKFVIVSQTAHSTNSKNPTISFIFKVHMNDTWQAVKDRLRCRLNLSQTVWDGDYRATVLLEDETQLDVDDTKCLCEYEELQSQFSLSLIYKYKAKRSCNKIDISC